MSISEHQHQKTVIEWANLMAQTNKYPMLKWLYAVPNGARTSRSVANRLKAEGMKAGVPDLCLPYPTIQKLPGVYLLGTETHHGLYIEMKSRESKGRMSKAQKEWIAYLLSVGYHVEVCWSADEAIKVIEEYLSG